MSEPTATPFSFRGLISRRSLFRKAGGAVRRPARVDQGRRRRSIDCCRSGGRSLNADLGVVPALEDRDPPKSGHPFRAMKPGTLRSCPWSWPKDRIPTRSFLRTRHLSPSGRPGFRAGAAAFFRTPAWSARPVRRSARHVRVSRPRHTRRSDHSCRVLPVPG